MMPTSTDRPNRIFLMLVGILLPLLGTAANLQAQDKPARSTTTLTPQQILELKEIAALRARMGGSVTERLQGVIPGGNPEQQFQESLRSIAGSQSRKGLTLQKPGPSPTRKAYTPLDIRTNPKSSDPDSTQQVLRSAARNLEGLAAVLEQAKFYDKADELRKTAGQYWQQARSMD